MARNITSLPYHPLCENVPFLGFCQERSYLGPGHYSVRKQDIVLNNKVSMKSPNYIVAKHIITICSGGCYKSIY